MGAPDQLLFSMLFLRLVHFVAGIHRSFLCRLVRICIMFMFPILVWGVVTHGDGGASFYVDQLSSLLADAAIARLLGDGTLTAACSLSMELPERCTSHTSTGASLVHVSCPVVTDEYD